jgi:indole-3-glycerol phosphate synthase
MSRFLAEMAQGSRRRLAEAKRSRPLAALEETAQARPDPRSLSGFGAVFDLIAEIKPRSPALGPLPVRDPLRQAEEYASGGAAMLSVLTEPLAFDGSLRLLEAVAERSPIPVLRKDFLVDPYQVYEARAAGADGVLLIGRLLHDSLLAEMLEMVAGLGMFALVEAFDADDLDRLVPAPGADHLLLGINCRDLDTLQVDPERHRRLARRIPPDTTTVAESAVNRPEDAEALARLGYRGVLVGTALMKAPHPAGLVADLIEAGRRARSVV